MGLNLKGGAGLTWGTPVQAVSSPAAAASQAPAVAAFGAGATVPVGGVGMGNSTSGNMAVWLGVAALAGLLLIRHSLPK
jgi:hypothetical protein